MHHAVGHEFKNIHVTPNPLNAAYDEAQAKLNTSQIHGMHGIPADSGQGSGHGSGLSIPTPPMTHHHHHGEMSGQSNGTHIIKRGSGTSIIDLAKAPTLHRHSTLREK